MYASVRSCLCVFVYVCARMRKSSHLLDAADVRLISINESHTNYIPFIISVSFNSVEFKEKLLVSKHETKQTTGTYKHLIL